MTRKVTALIFIITIAVLPTGASSWQVIAHYELGVEAGVDPERSYQMLPDSWPSHKSFLELLAITEWFAWSHAVVLTGKTDWVPNVPAISEDRRDPGQDMYDIYMQSRERSKDAYETALGFLSHNAQDKAVHYRFFRGGSVAAWNEEHQHKEIWADCWIFTKKIGKFDHGIPQGLPTIHNTGQAEIIEAAQKVFRKSGVSLADNERLYLPVESVGDIQERLQESERASIKYLSDFSERLCIEEQKWAKNYNWTQDELQEYYDKALEATRRIRKKFPPKPFPSNQAPPGKNTSPSKSKVNPTYDEEF